MAESLVVSNNIDNICAADVSLCGQVNLQKVSLNTCIDGIAEYDRIDFEDWEAFKKEVDQNMKRKEILSQYDIKQLPNNGKWWVRINGELKQRVNKKDLEDYIIDIATRTRPTIRLIWTDYLQSRKIMVASTTWQKDILYYDNYIVDSEIIDKPLEKLSLSDGQKFFLHCKAKKPDIKRKYWNNVHGLLNNIFRYAINEGLVQSNPFDNLSIGTNSFAPDAKHKDSDTTFSPDEQAAICSCAEETAISKKTALPLGIVLTFNLGIRLGELCAMKWSDLEESSHVHYVHIQRELVAEINDKGKVIGYTVLDHCKTPAGDRRLVLNSKAQDLFNTIRTLNIQNGIPVGENDYVFMRIRKKQLQLCNHKVFDSRIRVYCRHSGMSEAKSFHDIRRTVLTNLYYAGMPLKDIQKFAGHTSLQQTMDYIKIKEDDISTLSYLEALSTSKTDIKSDENNPKAVFKVA